MYPKLVDLPSIPGVGSLTVYTYGVLLAAAYLIGLKVAMVRGRRAGLNETRVMDLGIYAILSALVGAKLLLFAVDYKFFLDNPSELFSLVRSGGVFYGGLILAVAVSIWYLRRHQMPVWTTCDAFAPGIAVGHVVGRLGCLMAGCCYGRPTGVPWAITFTNPIAQANVGTPLGTPLHPTQLYEAGAELLILVGLLATERRGRPFPGRTFWGYLVAYAASRFVIEIYRGDPRGTVFGLVSTSQFISLALLPIALVMLAVLARRDRQPDATGARPARPRTA
jgi:phosphatidylglycerol:prolipoprotein diacylglycerol transferase